MHTAVCSNIIICDSFLALYFYFAVYKFLFLYLEGKKQEWSISLSKIYEIDH